ncbi:FAD-linked sulfhydryl oxidase [Hypsugopox virus]|nr:FAD-linked sulfhydryl oxidase [Hypsugopox virus]
MKPKHWGRAMWTVIFIIITKASKDGDIEQCKKNLYTIIDNLPCPACQTHAKKAMNDNNIMSSTDLNYIYYFFITLFNNLASDPVYKINIDKVKPLI